MELQILITVVELPRQVVLVIFHLYDLSVVAFKFLDLCVLSHHEALVLFSVPIAIVYEGALN